LNGRVPVGCASLACLAAMSSPADSAAPDTGGPPKYDRQAWLLDSLRATDLVVAGTPHKPASGSALLDVTRVLFQDPHAKPIAAGVPLRIVADRFCFSQGCNGIWILIRTPAGYASTNPDKAPLDEATWNRLQSLLASNIYQCKEPLVEHESNHQLYRTVKLAEKDVFHGVNTFSHSDGVFEELHERGVRLHIRAWDRQGRLERVGKLPDKGLGFFVQWDAGKLLTFSHFRDGKKTGLQRTYARGTDRLRHEVEFEDGVRHGLERRWNEKGELEFSERYQHGFLPPVIPYRGSGAAATLTKGEDRLYYSAPRELMAVFLERGVGMTTAQVSKLLKVDFSERTGITFHHFLCDTALHIEFKDGKVSKVYTLPNGAHCE
jgi:hypothetical protein